MAKYVSKSEFKPKAFEFFRLVENTNTEIFITDHGKPVVKIVPYSPSDDEDLQSLRGMVESYDRPFDPIDVEWDVMK